MSNSPQQSTYRQTERAIATDNTRRRIVESAVKLIHSSRRVKDLTLAQIADDAGVAMRTVLRHFGSSEGIFEAAFANIRDTISGNRISTPSGDLDAAIESLINHYERDGDLNIKALEEENDIPLLHRLLQIGRKFHMDWIESCFGPLLPPLSSAQRKATLLELYAATDVYLWKLLRRDLGQSRAATQCAFKNLIQGCIGQACTVRKGGRR